MIAIAAAAMLALGGCSSTSTIDAAFADVAPTNAQSAASGSDLAPAIALRNTGTYPNINNEPQSRLEPFADGEEAQAIAEMQALANQHAAGQISTAAYRSRVAQLRQLAATHSDQTLARIEGR